ncbi:ImmA/IrrE family metallo-endopeptidase [Mesorhizobium sp. M1273]|uniref:ImmA/IrrE family metallo-endopeptidase n=1 Tax=Mesorhizobium sp. M1273 TaxID=2957075 RepID=UPI00333C30D5
MYRSPNEDEIIRDVLSRAPTNIKEMISRLGLVYVERPMEDGLSGAIDFDGLQYVISVNEAEAEQRKRFTAAHELAHYLLHRDLMKERRHLDRLFDEAANRNPTEPLTYQHEMQANQFAARLLMPKATIESEIAKENDTIEGLAQTFGVSRQAMEYRLANLGLANKIRDLAEA